MAFGRSVVDLLETYSNCISLLRAFRHRREDPDSNGALEKQYRLRKSLKSDRTLVKRAYLSRVAEHGNRFRRGDARATSAVDRILSSLKNAITSLLRASGRSQGPDLDYESLTTLSNSSRMEAIKVIDSLSRRLGSPSRSSMLSTSSKGSSKKRSSSSSSRRKHRAPSESSGSALKAIEYNTQPRRESSTKKVSPPISVPKLEKPALLLDSPSSPEITEDSTPKAIRRSSHPKKALPKKRRSSPPASTMKLKRPSFPSSAKLSRAASAGSVRSERSAACYEARFKELSVSPTAKPDAPRLLLTANLEKSSALQPSKLEGPVLPSITLSPSPPPPLPEPSDAAPSPHMLLPNHLRPLSDSSKSRAGKRISMMSFASGSTKLGEIPERKWTSSYVSTTEEEDTGEYNVKPVFPLKSYTVEVKEKKFWGGLFGRKKDANSHG